MGDDNSPYLKAFILSSEQLALCERLQFHAGLISYVLLHNIEASSGLLQEIYEGNNQSDPCQEILVSYNNLLITFDSCCMPR